MKVSEVLTSVSLAGMLLVCACVTTTVDSGRLAAIERLAIVGFDAKYQVHTGALRETSSVTARAINVAADVAKDLSGTEAKERRDAGNWAYDRLVELLRENVAMDVVARDELQANDWYREQTAKLVGSPRHNVTSADGVVRTQMLADWTPQERDEYIEQLGVDAIATVRVAWINGANHAAGWRGLAGVEELRPAARVQLAIYERGREEPIWLEKGAVGCPSDEGVGDLGGVEIWRDMRGLLNQATEYGYVTLIEHYTEAAGTESGSTRGMSSAFAKVTRCM